MYQRHRYPTRIDDPMMALARYELDLRYRQAEHQRLLAQIRAARPRDASTFSAVRRWLAARLPIWARARQAQGVSAPPAELFTAIPEQQ